MTKQEITKAAQDAVSLKPRSTDPKALDIELCELSRSWGRHLEAAYQAGMENPFSKSNPWQKVLRMVAAHLANPIDNSVWTL